MGPLDERTCQIVSLMIYKTCNNDGFMIVFGLKLVYLWCFMVFSSSLRLSFIFEYANEIICISYHRKNGMCLNINVVPNLVL